MCASPTTSSRCGFAAAECIERCLRVVDATESPVVDTFRAVKLAERFDWHGRQVAWGRLGSGPPVVFCHGTPFSSLVWAPFARALQDAFTVYLWDMPGYGQSSKAAEHPVDLGVQGELFADLLAHWELDGPDVVAHDFGGAVSLRANILHGAAYRSLMLVDVVAMPPTGSPFFRFVGKHAAAMTELPDYIHEAILRAYIQTASARGLREDDLAALVEPWTTEEGKGAFYRQIEQTDEHLLEAIAARLRMLKVPVRILWGTDDAWIPVEVAHRLGGLVPDSTVRRIEGAGHLVHFDAPVALASEVRAWLVR
jgi:pimeloyl-ACP methyl ester carboxylesterase